LKSLMKRLKNERIVIGTVNTGSYPSPAEIMAPAARTSESKNNVAQMLATKKKKMILPVGDIEDEISDEAMLKKNQQDKIINYVTKNPMDAAKLINAWMHEDEV
ncbi:MAG: flagellar M-ring protein FliF, partial [Bacteroidota bacterium]